MWKRIKWKWKPKPKQNKSNQGKEAKPKKKLNFCQRCIRNIRNWNCGRIKRWFKRIRFGKKRKVSIRKNEEIVTGKKPTVHTLYRKKKYNSSKKSIPMKDTIANEVDLKKSFSKSTGKKLQSYLDDFKIDLNASEKVRLKQLADDYEQKNQKHSNKGFLKNIDMLKKKFSITLSKGLIMKDIFDDYKNKKYSFTGVIDTSKYEKSKLDINDLEKKDLDKIISHYKKQKKSKVDKKFSFRDLEIMNNIDAEGLKKKLSLTKSRQKLFKNMIEDYKKDKFKLSALPDDLKKDLKKIDKENFNKILDYYKSTKEKKRFSFKKQSKIKQMKSDIMAKLDSLRM